MSDTPDVHLEVDGGDTGPDPVHALIERVTRLEEQLQDKADAAAIPTDYAPAMHSHSEYASVDHSHPEYATHEEIPAAVEDTVTSYHENVEPETDIVEIEVPEPEPEPEVEHITAKRRRYGRWR